jgi:hypothetical protein
LAAHSPASLSLLFLGRLVAQVGGPDSEAALATLDKAHGLFQHNLDFVLDESVVFTNYGTSPLHLVPFDVASVTECERCCMCS